MKVISWVILLTEVKKVANNHTVGDAKYESQYLDSWAHICPLLLKLNMKETYLGILLKSRFCFWCSLKRRPPVCEHAC